MFVLIFVFLGYTFFIYKKVIPKVDYHLNGWNYDTDFLFTAIMRANEYTSYSMFPSRARKAGVYERYYELDPWTRRHFVIWMGLAFFVLLLGAIVGIMMQVFPELKRS